MSASCKCRATLSHTGLTLSSASLLPSSLWTRSPTILSHFASCTPLTSSPNCFWRLAQTGRPVSCPTLTTASYFLPLGWLPVCPPLSIVFPTSFSASSGHKCLRHSTRVLDTQVLICPSQDQVHSEVRELILPPFFQPFVAENIFTIPSLHGE